MPAAPRSPLVMIEADLALHLLMVPLDAPTELGEVHEALHRRRRRQIGEPELRRSLLLLRPGPDQPHLVAGCLAAEVMAGGPNANRPEARPLRSTRTLAPRVRLQRLLPQRNRELDESHGCLFAGTESGPSSCASCRCPMAGPAAPARCPTPRPSRQIEPRRRTACPARRRRRGNRGHHRISPGCPPPTPMRGSRCSASSWPRPSSCAASCPTLPPSSPRPSSPGTRGGGTRSDRRPHRRASASSSLVATGVALGVCGHEALRSRLTS
jgi:hypothetical protein